ncbi:MAG: type II toxin-antitoxin system VapC family toxin [Terriglobales bacterium]
MILDASVAAKWCLPDEAAAPADELLRRYLSRELHLLVPDLFWPEMANLLAHAVRGGRLRAAAAGAALSRLEQLRLPVMPTAALAPEACMEAIRWQLPAYDLFYLLLARTMNDVLITADERLVRALGHRFPVRGLSAASVG